MVLMVLISPVSLLDPRHSERMLKTLGRLSVSVSVSVTEVTTLMFLSVEMLLLLLIVVVVVVVGLCLLRER